VIGASRSLKVDTSTATRIRRSACPRLELWAE